VTNAHGPLPCTESLAHSAAERATDQLGYVTAQIAVDDAANVVFTKNLLIDHVVFGG
jgi:hypothetical protein